MVYPVLNADGILVGQLNGNGRVVCHSLSIFNDDAATSIFRVRQGTVTGTIIWEMTVKADSTAHFYFPKPLEGEAFGASNAGDLFMDTTGTTVTISGVCEQGVIPSG